MSDRPPSGFELASVWLAIAAICLLFWFEAGRGAAWLVGFWTAPAW